MEVCEETCVLTCAPGCGGQRSTTALAPKAPPHFLKTKRKEKENTNLPAEAETEKLASEEVC